MKLLRFLPLFVLFLSCNTINKEERIPAFIRIDRFDINPGFLGAKQHNITDAWITVDNEFIGVFELPTILPVLQEGDVEVSITAGIKNMGMSEDRITYPLTQNYKTNTHLIPDMVTTIEPTLDYFEELILNSSSEEFSGISIGFEFINGSIQIMEDTTMDSSPLNDTQVGQLTPSIDGHLIEVLTANAISVTPEGPTMLEFNYKANYNFYVGIKFNLNGAATQKEYLLGLNPSFDADGSLGWRKIYINLETTMKILNTQGDETYKIFFETDTENNEVDIRLDNFKIISL